MLDHEIAAKFKTLETEIAELLARLEGFTPVVVMLRIDKEVKPVILFAQVAQPVEPKPPVFTVVPEPTPTLAEPTGQTGCNEWIKKNCPGQSYPRTCKTCGMGPCRFNTPDQKKA